MVLFKTILQDTTQSRTQGLSVIPQSLSIQKRLSLYAQVSVLQEATQCRTQGSSVIPQSISIQIRLSLYSEVSVLQDTIQSRTKGSHESHSQYKTGYYLVCILRYLSDKIQLNVIPKLYISFKKVIQDASPSLTKKNYSHTLIKAECYSN